MPAGEESAVLAGDRVSHPVAGGPGGAGALRLKSQLDRLDLLVLDELGYVPASKVGAELLFDVISSAYERTSVVVTTNLPFEQWTEVLGSERLVGATLDRLTHRCHILEATGESYRLRDARRRQGTGRRRSDATCPTDGA